MGKALVKPVKNPSAAGRSSSAAAPALLERQAGPLRSYLAHLLAGDAARAGGLVQEVMAEADPEELEGNPAVWLFARGRRRVFGTGQRNDPLATGGASGAGDAVDDEPVAEGEDPQVIVHRMLERLTPKQQEVLRLKFQFGFGLDEMAQILGLTNSGAGSLLHHAVQRVGQALGGNEGERSLLGRNPRMTAYALDEMDDAEREGFEASNPNGKALVKESELIRDWCVQIGRAVESGAPLPRRRRRRRGAWWSAKRAGVLLAAVAAAGVALFFWRRESVGDASRPTGLTAAPAELRAGASVEPSASSQGGAVADRRSGNGGAGGGLGFEHIVGVDRNRRPYARGNGTAAGAGGGGEGSDSGPAFSGYSGEGAGPAGGADGRVGPPPGDPGGGDPATARGSSSDTGDEGRSDARFAAGGEVAAADDKAGEVSFRSSSNGSRRPGPIARTVSRTSSKPGGSTAGGSADAAGPGSAATAEVAPEPAMDSAASPGLAGLRRQLAAKRWPQPEDVEMSELMERVPPAEPLPETSEALVAERELTASPWDPAKRLLRVAVRGRDAPVPVRGRANLVFAIDVSGSMIGPNRLPLVQEGIRRLVDRLQPDDQVAVVTYAERAELLLPVTPAARAAEVRRSLAGLAAAGMTDGSEGLRLAYEVARSKWIEGGLNVVVLCTDGNFNLGTTDERALAGMVAAESQRGAHLSVFGFGRNDRNDLRLELLATQGGGRSCYVNTREEAERLLVQQIDGLFAPVAADLWMEVEFDPALVAEARRLDHDDEGDGRGTVGLAAPSLLPGGSLAMIFEIKPTAEAASREGDWAQIRVAYGVPGFAGRKRSEQAVAGVASEWGRMGADFRFAVALAEFGRILRGEPVQGRADLDRLSTWVDGHLPDDAGGYRSELSHLLEQAKVAADPAGQLAGLGAK